MWCWRRLLNIPRRARISNQSLQKEINPEYSLEGLMLKLKLQYFGHLKKKSWLIEKTLMLGKIEGRRREQQRMRWLNVITNSMGMSFSKLQEIVKGRAAWWALVHGVTKSQTQCSNWTIIMLDRTSLTLAAMLVAPFWGDLRFSWGGQILKHSCLTGIG